jgi:N-acetylmuramoyl-L-alanine amidase
MGKKASDITVAIWAGHGKSTDGSWDPGCVYKGYTEAELVLPIAKAANAALIRCGFNTLTDAVGNKINMIKQVEQANAKDADIHVSLHLEWSGAPKGTYPICASGEGKKLANCINKAVMREIGMTTRGVKKTDAYYETSATSMTAVIFECGAIKADLKKIQKHKVYGEAIAEGICDYFGVPYVEEEFKVRAKKNLIVRKTAALTSKKTGTANKGIYTIVKVSSNGKRGKLKSGAGWITITDKYCEKL